MLRVLFTTLTIGLPLGLSGCGREQSVNDRVSGAFYLETILRRAEVFGTRVYVRYVPRVGRCVAVLERQGGEVSEKVSIELPGPRTSLKVDLSEAVICSRPPSFLTRKDGDLPRRQDTVIETHLVD